MKCLLPLINDVLLIGKSDFITDALLTRVAAEAMSFRKASIITL
jgi:hypothetical protein